MEYWYDPKVMDLAADDENLKELGAGLLLAGSISTTVSALEDENSGTFCCCMPAAATAQTLPGGNFGWIDAAPHPSPEDRRGLLIGATVAERIDVL